jgi:proline iminopeptidase
MKKILPIIGSIVSVFASPFNEGYLPVDDLHEMHYAEYGNPNGEPVLVVHGGPGWGCPPAWVSFFDEEHYRIVMFDQRGAGLSRPHAEMQDNTPQKLVEDMELLRNFLGIEKWHLFGGSWGSALSLLYGETHPERVSGFVLRGVFLARERDYLHLFYGMKDVYPEAFDEALTTLNVSESEDLVSKLHQMVMSDDLSVAQKAAHAFMKFDTICATMLPNEGMVEAVANNDKMVLGTARTYTHYAANGFFLEENQLLQNIDRVAHLPVIIVQGRHDAICPPIGAYQLHKAWPGSELWMIPDGGHSSSEPTISTALRKATDSFLR